MLSPLQSRCSRATAAALLSVALFATGAAAQVPVVTAGRPPTPLSALVGTWQLTGTVRGQPVRYAAAGEWRLADRWLVLRMRDLGRPSRYAADVYLAADSAGRLTAHWLDTFGPGPARTLGQGAAQGDTLEPRFEYPDGPMRDRLVIDRARGTWALAIDAADSAGVWRPFAAYTAVRASAAPGAARERRAPPPNVTLQWTQPATAPQPFRFSAAGRATELGR